MTPTLLAIQNRAEGIELAIEKRDELIRKARAEGESLRAIAAAAKMSHESVRSLIRHADS